MPPFLFTFIVANHLVFCTLNLTPELQKMTSDLAAVKAFVADALEVVEFKLIRDSKDVNETESFHPDMAHQIFGQEESIFGYKDLSIKFYYSAGPLDLYFKTEYTKKVKFINILVFDA